ncbi:DUF4097 family beta strand repeat-containing protein [Sediminibacterium soli]|uniref:hypothetical protein n=1 Tax=Sediminibacterium soli TaxID=2698829 RepID=UPI00137B6233|nr:hypothetical protein [Sediminibacterium soli]NCI45605.1 hypothetical protein [Sediminibacterium soli]
MKKYLIVTMAALFAITALQAQFKLAKSTGKLVIHLSSVRVEGYSGSEIIFTSGRHEKDDDERAKGLRPINGSGLSDNTGIGINVADKGNTVEVNQVSSRDGEVVIKVPKSMSVSYTFDKVMNAGKSEFKDLDGELEISVQHNKVSLENVTGPLTVKSVYGGVEARFKDNIKGPLSLVSIYGFVDVAVPATTKANISMKTSYGELLAASGLNIELEKTTSGDMIRYSNSNVKGKLNGGGTELTLRSDYGKIYLRKAE